MFDSINLNEINWRTLPNFKKNNIFQYQGQLLKIISEKDRTKIMKIHQFFLMHPIDFCFTPKKVLFFNDNYIGYSMEFHQEYQPISSYKNTLSKEEKWQIIDQVYDYLMIMNDYFIYTDIDEDNLLYDGNQLKIIDFDDIKLKSELSKDQERRLLQDQQMLFNLFATALLYNVSIYDTYYLTKTDKLTLTQKEEIQNLLKHQGYLTSQVLHPIKKAI